MPRLPQSEIFEKYAELMEDKGLVKKAEEYKNAVYPRVGSDDLDTIQLMYGIKSEPEKEQMITEVAHPNAVIVGPSYDKAIGFLWNDKVKQDFAINIIMETNNGMNTHKKYAEKLALSLAKIATKLDMEDKDQLRILADTCLEQLSKKKIEKIAFWGVALSVGAAAVAALVAANRLGPKISQGVAADIQEVKEQLNDIMQDPAVLNNEQIHQSLNDLNTRCVDLSTYIHQFFNLEHTSENGQEIINKAKSDPKLAQEIKKEADIIVNIQKEINDFLKKIPGYTLQLHKLSQLQERSGTLERGFKALWHGFKGEPVDDVVVALTTLQKSLQSFLNDLDTAYKQELSIINEQTVQSSVPVKSLESTQNKSEHQTAGAASSLNIDRLKAELKYIGD